MQLTSGSATNVQIGIRRLGWRAIFFANFGNEQYREWRRRRPPPGADASGVAATIYLVLPVPPPPPIRELGPGSPDPLPPPPPPPPMRALGVFVPLVDFVR